MTLSLTPDELLSTTRAVRRRLDLDRPVERHLVEECLELATQAPSGSNTQGWHFVVVTDPATRAALGEVYRRAYELYRNSPVYIGGLFADDPDRAPVQQRTARSADHLAEVMGRVPVLVVPCLEGRLDGQASFLQAAQWGSLLPAVWSFMLAARARGLGTSWTTIHLMFEAEVAELLGIPFAEVTQAALIPLAHSVGTEFRPGPRVGLDRIVHWERW